MIMTGGDVLQITLNPGVYAPGSTVTLAIKRLNAGIWIPVTQFAHAQISGVQTFTYTADVTGYYAFAFGYSQPGSVAALSVGDLTLVVGGAGAYPCTVWGQKSLPGYVDNFAFVEALRITAVSLMYTNTASNLNNQGQIVGLQAPKGSAWLQFTDFQTVAADKKSVTRDIKEGNYGFLKPTSTLDIAAMVIYELPSDGIQATQYEDNVFTIYPESDYLVTIASCNVLAGQVGYLTIAAALEYTTLNQWIEVRRGKLTDQELKEALFVLSGLQQWHTNELHWDDIWEGIKDVGRSIWSGIKDVAPVLAAAAPMLL